MMMIDLKDCRRKAGAAWLSKKEEKRSLTRLSPPSPIGWERDGVRVPLFF
jgi:hypothetical protein